jgi:hypothetical protein
MLWIILGVLALGIITAGAAIFWFNRPIEPTVLTPPEKKALQEKLAVVEKTREEPSYQPGAKTIELSERELNGLLHNNTSLGDQLKLEFAKNALHARLNTDLPPDVPLVGGKKLKGRARFLVKTTAGAPELILDDVTIWGISVPNAWLGEVKGQNLLGSLLPASASDGNVGGIRKIRVTDQALIIELAE